MNNSKIEALLKKAWAKRREEKYEEARSLVEQARHICPKDDYNALGRIYHIYMQFESDHDNPSQAMGFCRQSINYYRQAGNQNRVAHATRHLADLQNRLGKEADSEDSYREAINIYRKSPDVHPGDLANALRGFGLILEKRGKITEAVAIWQETKDLYQNCNIQAGVDEASQRLAALS